MNTLTDVLRFRVMIAPYLLEALFWAGMAGTVYGAYWLFSHDHWAWWIAFIFGSALTRVVFEFGLLAFRSYERLVEMRDLLASSTSVDRQ